MVWPNTPGTVHGRLGITYHTNEKASVTADYLETQFTSHDLCDENHERQVETTVQALLASVNNTPLVKVRLCETHKLANTLKVTKACGLEGIPKECLRYLHEDHRYSYIRHIYLLTAFGCLICTFGKFPSCTLVREFRMNFQVPYIYDYVKKLFRQGAVVIQYYENANVRNIGKVKSDKENIRSFCLAAVKRTTVQVTRLQL
jgi:hypothetical protein